MASASHDNLDQRELQRFESAAHRWWDKDGEFRPLHELNPVRFNYVATRVELAGKSVLDVGCGGGLLTEAMAAAGADALGVDMGETAVRVAQLHALETGSTARYRQTPVATLVREQPGAYDVVTCMELLEHLPDPADMVQQCSNALKPGGTAFFSTINRSARAYGLAVLGAEYVLHLLPRGTHDYAKFIRPSELARWLRDAGLLLHDITGMRYNPLTKTAALTTDVSVNYLVCCGKP